MAPAKGQKGFVLYLSNMDIKLMIVKKPFQKHPFLKEHSVRAILVSRDLTAAKKI